MPKAFLQKLGEDYGPAVRAGLEWTGVTARLRRGDTVFIKPNLTFPVFRKGVMTNPACVEAVVAAFKDHTDRIVIGEADSGGYNRFNISDVQARIGLVDIARRYGAELVNLSRLPAGEIAIRSGSRDLRFPFPRLLMDEADVVVSVGVPKIHMNTLVSMTVKNLWGCIPEPPVRLRLHPYLGDVLAAIVTRLKSVVAVIDGRYGLNRSGPMLGDPVDLNWLLVADDLYAADALCCHLMQIDPRRVAYLRDVPVETNTDPAAFIGPRFYLRRAWTDYPGLMAFHSPFLSYLAYFSPLADILHKILYLFRKPFYNYDHPGQTPEDGSDG